MKRQKRGSCPSGQNSEHRWARYADRFRDYDRDLIPPEHEYRGLTESDTKWLRKFNLELSNRRSTDAPLFTKTKDRKALNHSQHARRVDAMRFAESRTRDEYVDPTGAIFELIDRHDRLQRVRRK